MVLKIGAGKGVTLFLLTRITASNALLVNVDLLYIPKCCDTLIESFHTKDQTIQLIRGDSHNMDTLNRVRQYLDRNSVDLLFIDGDHGYYGVKMEFEFYSQLVRE